MHCIYWNITLRLIWLCRGLIRHEITCDYIKHILTLWVNPLKYDVNSFERWLFFLPGSVLCRYNISKKLTLGLISTKWSIFFFYSRKWPLIIILWRSSFFLKAKQPCMLFTRQNSLFCTQNYISNLRVR